MRKKYGSIVKLRRMREEDVARQMQELRVRLRRDEEELETLRSRVSAMDRSLGRVMREGARRTLHELQLHAAYLGRLAEAEKAQGRRVKERRREVSRKREELGEAAKERRIAETLQEKDWRRTMDEARRKEQKEIDETATLRFSRMD